MLLASCATIPNSIVCTPAGLVTLGGICGETQTSKTWDLTFEEFIYFLEAQAEHPDPNEPTHTVPAKGAAMCQSSEDYQKQKTALETACRLLGPRCSYEIKKQIKTMQANIDRLLARSEFTKLRLMDRLK